ncbi:MAG: geranylgeranyl reductase family protein [Thermoplasmatota archaeon]
MDEPEIVVVDCLVIGAGPAGSVAAREVAKDGWKVLLIEKRPEVGVPVRCGEGISKSLLNRLGLEKDPRFVDSEMDGALIHSPGGHEIILGPEIAGPEVGFVIRREYFDQHLAAEAVSAGAELWVRAEAMGMKKVPEGYEVDVEHIMGRKLAKARIVVAADGFESKVARWAGMDTSLKVGDIDTCLQYEMVGVECDRRYTEFFVGKKYAPGGYVWCFPKGPDIANIGIGLNGAMIKKPAEVKTYLDKFIRENGRFSKGTITEINGGGVSVSLPLEEMTADNFIVVGDAARMIDPLTGGGIYNACIGALHAGAAVSRALKNADCSGEMLRSFETEWRKELEEEMARNYMAKEKLLSISDETLDKIISSVADYDLKDISTEELLKAVISKHPEIMEDLEDLL